MRKINGKTYPMWESFVENKEKWIGGRLLDEDMGNTIETEIVDITLEENGPEHAMFMVHGKDYSCGFCTSVGGVGGRPPEGWIGMIGYCGYSWRIKPREERKQGEKK